MLDAKDCTNDDIWRLHELVDLLLEANELVKDMDLKLSQRLIRMALLETVQSLQKDLNE